MQDDWDDVHCADCGEGDREYEDPREPPLEEDNCLCLDCYIGAIDEAIGYHEDELIALHRKLEIAQKEQKKRSKK